MPKAKTPAYLVRQTVTVYHDSAKRNFDVVVDAKALATELAARVLASDTNQVTLANGTVTVRLAEAPP